MNTRPINITDFDDAFEMTLEAYNLEKLSCSAFPDKPNINHIRQQLKSILEKGVGRIAFEAGKPVGFLAFEKMTPTGESGFNSAVSPLFCYGVRHDDRGTVIGKLFQDTAAELCENYVQNIQVNVYAHDTEVLWMYIMSSFAMDVTEVIKDVNSPPESKSGSKFICREVLKTELVNYRNDIIELYRDLINHLRVSPVFYHCKYFLPIENRFDDFYAEGLRLFAAFDGDKLIGMIASEPVDIAMFAHDPESRCMGDVFVKPDYRGLGAGIELLRFASEELKKDGIRRLFVTHGTINPNARGFWDKYFTNYSYSMTRSIDSSMLGEIEKF